MLTSGWHPADSQLTLASKFVPLLYSMLELGQPGGRLKTAHFVGQPVRSPAIDFPRALPARDRTRKFPPVKVVSTPINRVCLRYKDQGR